MTAPAKGMRESVKAGPQPGCAETAWPEARATPSSAKPNAVAAATRPPPRPLMMSPMSIAIGIVAVTVNNPQGLSARRLTTTSASTADQDHDDEEACRSSRRGRPSGPV